MCPPKEQGGLGVMDLEIQNKCLLSKWLFKLIVGTPGLGYPLLLCLGKSLVVILNYALTAEQPDPCGPEPCSPGRTAPDPLPAWGGSGDAT